MMLLCMMLLCMSGEGGTVVELTRLSSLHSAPTTCSPFQKTGAYQVGRAVEQHIDAGIGAVLENEQDILFSLWFYQK